jgi:hypothetical protein
MHGSPYHTIGYQLNGESRMQVYEGWSPFYELRLIRYGKLTISMAECEELVLV